jgi:hypothetical protein
MSFTPASPGSVTAFDGIIVAVCAAVVAGTYVANRRLGVRAGIAARRTVVLAVVLLIWLTLTSAVVARGALAAAPMPRVPLFFAAANLGAMILAFSPVGGRLAQGLPLAALVAFQAFRLPLEAVLHAWVARGTIPTTMTWTGQNFDVITGVLALAAAPFARHSTPRGRAVAWVFNVVGFALLLNVMRVAVMSSPLPFAWRDMEPPLQLVMHLPYALIVTVCVAGALAGHIVLTRALLVARHGV